MNHTNDVCNRIIDFAMDMTTALHRYNDTCQILKSRSLALNIRIGINTGPVVAGIIGRTRYEILFYYLLCNLFIFF